MDAVISRESKLNKRQSQDAFFNFKTINIQSQYP